MSLPCLRSRTAQSLSNQETHMYLPCHRVSMLPARSLLRQIATPPAPGPGRGSSAIAPAGRAPYTPGHYTCMYMRATGPVQVAPGRSWTRRPRYQPQLAPEPAVEVAWPNPVARERSPTRCENQVAPKLAQQPTRTLARRCGTAGFGRIILCRRYTPACAGAGAQLLSSGSVRCPDL